MVTLRGRSPLVPPPFSTPRRVLIVEAEPHSQRVLEPLLQQEGHEVRLAGSGEAAVDAMDSRAPDIVVVDLTLPRIAVFATLKRVRAFDPQPPVIGVSHRDGGRPHALSDITCHVFRPFHVPALVAAVRRALGLPLAPEVEKAPKRAHRRCSVVLDTVLLSREGRTLGEGKILNLSAGGAQPHLDMRLEIGRRIFIGFRVPGRLSSVTLPARVQWRNPATHRFAFGVQFEEVAADVDRVLKEVVESVRSD
jgi:CheY-like chemotaxis protein